MHTFLTTILSFVFLPFVAMADPNRPMSRADLPRTPDEPRESDQGQTPPFKHGDKFGAFFANADPGSEKPAWLITVGDSSTATVKIGSLDQPDGIPSAVDAELIKMPVWKSAGALWFAVFSFKEKFYAIPLPERPLEASAVPGASTGQVIIADARDSITKAMEHADAPRQFKLCVSFPVPRAKRSINMANISDVMNPTPVPPTCEETFKALRKRPR